MPIALRWTDAAGTATELSDGSPHSVRRMRDSGLPPIKMVSDPAPGRAGVSDRLARLGARTVTLDMVTSAATDTLTEDAIRDLGEAVAGSVGRQLVREGILRLTTSGGDVRQLIAKGLAGAGLDESARSGPLLIRHRLRLEAARPFWYDPTEKTASGVVLPLGGGLVVNVRTPVRITPSGPHVSLDLSYGGSAETWSLVVEIEGPSVNPSITHGQTGFGLSFSKIVPTGATLTVTLGPRPVLGDPGRFTARIGGASVLADLGALRRPFPLTVGDNQILIQQDNADANAVSVRWYDEFVTA